MSQPALMTPQRWQEIKDVLHQAELGVGGSALLFSMMPVLPTTPCARKWSR